MGSLKTNHLYYYQIQTQMHVCLRSYCDLVVWSESCGIIYERKYADERFFSSIIDDIQHLFIYEVLPEVVGKWYTRQPLTDSMGVVPTLNEIENNDEMV